MRKRVGVGQKFLYVKTSMMYHIKVIGIVIVTEIERGLDFQI